MRDRRGETFSGSGNSVCADFKVREKISVRFTNILNSVKSLELCQAKFRAKISIFPTKRLDVETFGDLIYVICVTHYMRRSQDPTKV